MNRGRGCINPEQGELAFDGFAQPVHVTVYLILRDFRVPLRGLDMLVSHDFAHRFDGNALRKTDYAAESMPGLMEQNLQSSRRQTSDDKT